MSWLKKHWYALFFILIIAVALCLRLWRVDANPPGLYWDELSLGYDAWSIATTARDYHGNFLPFLAFESYGDYKPGGYIYALAPFFWVFGKHDLAVRLPSVLAGVAIVIALGQLTAWFLGEKSPRARRIWTLVAMAVATITPSLWHLSRVGFETNLATAFLLWGMVLFLPFLEAKKLNFRFLLGTVCFLASFLTYHSARVSAPLLALFLLGAIFCQAKNRQPWLKWLKENLVILSIGLLLGLLVAAPFLLSLSQGGTVASRFQTESIFNNLELVTASNQCYELSDMPRALSNLWCHRFWYFGAAIAKNFLAHLNLDYLFLHGEGNLRHSTGLFGVYYLTDFVWLSVGAFALWWQRKEIGVFKIILALFWLLAGLLPASLTLTTPHLLRSLAVVPLGVILIVMGINCTVINLPSWLKAQHFLPKLQKFFLPILMIIISTAYLVQALLFNRYYWHYYPVISEHEWQSSYKAVMSLMGGLQEKYPDLPVYIDRELGRASMYYFWYEDIPPSVVQQHTREKMDQGEFVTFDRVNFIAPTDAEQQIVAFTVKNLEKYLAANPEMVLEDEWQISDRQHRPIWIGGVLRNKNAPR